VRQQAAQVLIEDEPLGAAGGRVVERHLLRVRHQPLRAAARVWVWFSVKVQIRVSQAKA